MLTDLAAGLGVIGGGVLGEDAEALQFGLEEHLALAGLAGEDGAIVGEQGRGETVEFAGGVEALDDVERLEGDTGVRPGGASGRRGG
jgi:hypothetical protein